MRSLVLVHGFMGDPSDWDYVRSEISDFEIITPLIRPAVDWEAGVAQLAGDIPLGSIVVGYSMGARLTLGVGLSWPDKMKAMVFCSGNPGIEEDSLREARYKHDMAIASAIEASPRSEFLHRWYTESTVFKSLTAKVRADEIRRKLARSADDWCSILQCYTVANQPNYWPRLSELSVPTMAIAGAEDRKYARFIARMGELPQIDSRIVSACGHIVHREQPHVFLRLLKEFLRTVCLVDG